MPRLSLSPTFIKDSFQVFKDRGIKGLLFGNRAKLTEQEAAIMSSIENGSNAQTRSGILHKIDAIHKGRGHIYLAPHPKNSQKSMVVFGSDIHIANGPDLWLYLSSSNDPKKDFGNFLNLGQLKGNKGAQVYEVDHPFGSLKDRKTVIIYCKQFDVLFSFAHLK